MHKISVSLGDIDDAIRQLEDYEKKVQQNIKDFVQKLLDTGVEIAKATIYELDAVDTLKLYNSVKEPVLYKDGSGGVIFTDSPYAAFVEFGTGVANNGSVGSSNHPLGVQLGMTIGTYGEGKGANPDGWYYYDNEQGRLRYTQGMPSRPFMYSTAKEMERIAAKVAKEVFSR